MRIIKLGFCRSCYFLHSRTWPCQGFRGFIFLWNETHVGTHARLHAHAQEQIPEAQQDMLSRFHFLKMKLLTSQRRDSSATLPCTQRGGGGKKVGVKNKSWGRGRKRWRRGGEEREDKVVIFCEHTKYICIHCQKDSSQPKSTVRNVHSKYMYKVFFVSLYNLNTWLT